jgi:NAD(P)-dependent dehydrogenase (short-subunit alcohol dehydrogenase family)
MTDAVGFDRVAIVTGCSSGIGLATTLLFLKHRYQVFGIDINAFDYKALDSLDGGQSQTEFHFLLEDLTKPGACEAGVKACIAEFG